MTVFYNINVKQTELCVCVYVYVCYNNTVWETVHDMWVVSMDELIDLGSLHEARWSLEPSTIAAVLVARE